MKDTDLREAVRDRFGSVARQGRSCGGFGTQMSSRDKEFVAAASRIAGDVVLDLGAGFDAFLAAEAVGERGHVIGVDMTPEMVGRARENAAQSGAANVEFRLGEIENLPVESGSVDVAASDTR